MEDLSGDALAQFVTEDILLVHGRYGRIFRKVELMSRFEFFRSAIATDLSIQKLNLDASFEQSQNILTVIANGICSGKKGCLTIKDLQLLDKLGADPKTVAMCYRAHIHLLSIIEEEEVNYDTRAGVAIYTDTHVMIDNINDMKIIKCIRHNVDIKRKLLPNTPEGLGTDIVNIITKNIICAFKLILRIDSESTMLQSLIQFMIMNNMKCAMDACISYLFEINKNGIAKDIIMLMMNIDKDGTSDDILKSIGYNTHKISPLNDNGYSVNDTDIHDEHILVIKLIDTNIVYSCD
jgi:hypothetical protein